MADSELISSHYCHVIEKLNILCFDHFIKFGHLELINKCLCNQAPQGFTDSVVPLSISGSNRNCKCTVVTCLCHLNKQRVLSRGPTCGIPHCLTSNWILTGITETHTETVFKERSVTQSWIMYYCVIVCILYCSVCIFLTPVFIVDFVFCSGLGSCVFVVEFYVS